MHVDHKLTTSHQKKKRNSKRNVENKILKSHVRNYTINIYIQIDSHATAKETLLSNE